MSTVNGDDQHIECNICLEDMNGRGRVVLKCKHVMCPECFAMHARINNTCPFCRDEFAPKTTAAKGSIPLDTVEQIIVDHLLSDRNFYYLIIRRINYEIEPARQVAIMRTVVGNMCLEAMQYITRWYDNRDS